MISHFWDREIIWGHKSTIISLQPQLPLNEWTGSILERGSLFIQKLKHSEHEGGTQGGQSCRWQGSWTGEERVWLEQWKGSHSLKPISHVAPPAAADCLHEGKEEKPAMLQDGGTACTIKLLGPPCWTYGAWTSYRRASSIPLSVALLNGLAGEIWSKHSRVYNSL